ncbi:YceI family protein [Aquisalimonas asiatica]|uniref:Polyisoprenoid-binding protein YceI n=1 Tax=Aquisalimonas asiatica TaxID=406100 RepID=A0A1H8TJW6_9GAMM|nr:YceI family protein [Aquisalimonas asiatica]SEO91121.1 Polyisoprenoid-binding protein YceI [Aquisalimonas asiatica]
MTTAIPRRRMLLGALLAAALAGADQAHADADHWVIDEAHLSVNFLVDHIGFSSVLGMFLDAEGEFVYDPDAMELESGRVVIRTDSVFTNHEERDEHLRDDDFLDTGEYTEMIFTATSFEPDSDDGGQLTGDLELLGVTRPVTLDVTINRIDEYPIRDGFFGGYPFVLGASLRGTLNRSDWGMHYGIEEGLVGDEVELILELEARRQ